MDYETSLEQQINENADKIADDLINGRPLFEPAEIVTGIKDLLLLEIKDGVALGVEITAICVIMGLLASMSDSFGSKAASRLAAMVCSCLIVCVCMANFTETYNCCTDTVSVMTTTMQIMLPVLIPLLIAIGGISSGSILDPVIAGAVTGFSTVLEAVVLPVLFISSTLVLINSFTEKSYLKRLSIFLRRAALFVTGLLVTVFTGITSIQGIMTKSADGLLINTARYSIDNFVPIVGRFASDSIDMVLNCGNIIKNSLGLAGIIAITAALSGPVIKMIAVAVIYKITAVIAELTGTSAISDTLNEMGNSVISMTVVLGLTGLMFLIFITVIISVGGGTLWN